MVLGALVVVMIVAVVLLVGIPGGGGDGGGQSTKSSAPHSKTTQASSTTSTTTRRPFTYTVKPGNTVTALARFFGVSKSDITAANPNLDADHLVAGQTLVIPSPRTATLKVKPATVAVGGTIRLKVTGAQDFENVTFEFQRPTTPFVGPPHSASETGVVTTTYTLGIADPPGTYTVTAKGDQGTTVQATFTVTAARP